MQCKVGVCTDHPPPKNPHPKPFSGDRVVLEKMQFVRPGLLLLFEQTQVRFGHLVCLFFAVLFPLPIWFFSPVFCGRFPAVGRSVYAVGRSSLTRFPAVGCRQRWRSVGHLVCVDPATPAVGCQVCGKFDFGSPHPKT